MTQSLPNLDPAPVLPGRRWRETNQGAQSGPRWDGEEGKDWGSKHHKGLSQGVQCLPPEKLKGQ